MVDVTRHAEGDFYEEDEPVDDVILAFEDGEKGLTHPPLHSSYYQVTTEAPATRSTVNTVRRRPSGSWPVTRRPSGDATHTAIPA
jgi:hypothetical protein